MKAFRFNGQPIGVIGAWADVPMELYHGGHLCEGRSVSGSSLAKMLRSPAHYWSSSPLNPNAALPKKSDALEFGKAAHCLALEGREKFEAEFVISEFDDYRSKAAQLWKAEQTRPIVSRSGLETIEGMALALQRHPHALALFRDGLAELTFVAKDAATGLWLLTRPDFTPAAGARGIVSYKTTANGEPEAFSYDAFRHAYDVKAALALDVLELAIGEKRAGCWEVVQEKEPPYVVTVLLWSPDHIKRGRARVRQALDALARSFELHDAGEPEQVAWPGYATDPVSIITPYRIAKEIEGLIA